MLTLRQYSREVINEKLTQFRDAFETKKIASVVIALDSRSNDKFKSNLKYIEVFGAYNVNIIKGLSPGKSNAQKTASFHLNHLNGVILNDLDCLIKAKDWDKALNDILSNINAVITYNISFSSNRNKSSKYFKAENKLREIESFFSCLFTSSGQLMYVPLNVLQELPDDVGDDCFCGLFAQFNRIQVKHSHYLYGLDEKYPTPIMNFSARRRMVVRNLPYTCYIFYTLLTERPLLAFFIFFHKLFRWLLPMSFPLILCFLLFNSLQAFCLSIIILIGMYMFSRNLFYGIAATLLGGYEALAGKRITHY